MRKQFPGTPTANGIEDAVEDLAATVFWRAATGFAGRHERYQPFPFCIGEIGIVSASRRSQPARVNNRGLLKLPLMKEPKPGTPTSPISFPT